MALSRSECDANFATTMFRDFSEAWKDIYDGNSEDQAKLVDDYKRKYDEYIVKAPQFKVD